MSATALRHFTRELERRGLEGRVGGEGGGERREGEEGRRGGREGEEGGSQCLQLCSED